MYAEKSKFSFETFYLYNCEKCKKCIAKQDRMQSMIGARIYVTIHISLEKHFRKKENYSIRWNGKGKFNAKLWWCKVEWRNKKL